MTPVIDIDPTLVIWHDAVKIGLGALIGASSAIFVAWITSRNARNIAEDNNRTTLELAEKAHRDTLTQTLADERKALIHEAARLVSEVEISLLTTATEAARLRERLHAEDIPPSSDHVEERRAQLDELENRLQILRDETKDGFRKIGTASGNLLLLGEQSAQQEVATLYNRLTNIASLFARPNPPTGQAANELLSAADEQKLKTFQAIAKAYKRIE